jgi:hypothetical protein
LPQKEVSSPAALAWKQLCAYLNEWYYKPDTEALAIALAAATAHYGITGDPVWLFVVGPSSSGKTGIVINALSALPSTHDMGDLTSKTFISHYDSKNKDSGFLHEMGESGILLFKDFTTILSKREDERNEITAQLREIYDGKFSRRTGVGGKSLWRGKVTVIAAATPAIERAWMVKRELGERFVMVKWPRSGHDEMAMTAHRQRGQERTIGARVRDLTKQFCLDRQLAAATALPDKLARQLAALSSMTAVLRASVTRNSSGAREVIDIPCPEEPGRLMKVLALLCSSHAALFEHAEPNEEDVAIARRVALDSIPDLRRKMIESIPLGAKISRADLYRLTGIPPSSILWAAQELEALGVVQLVQTTVEYEINFTTDFENLGRRAGIFLNY